VVHSRRDALRAGGVALAAGITGCSFSTSSSISNGAGTVLSVATDDGSERWTRDFGVVDADPSLADGTIYVGSEETLHALDPSDGSSRWTVELDVGSFPEIGRPAVADDTVLAPVKETLVALAAADGTERWRFEAEEDDGVWAAPPVVNGTAIVGAGESAVHGVALGDGNERWRFEGENLEAGSTTIGEGTAFLNSRGGRVHAIDPTDGSERWTAETEKPVGGTPAVGDDAVYVGTTGRRLYALSTADGSERWSADTSGGPGNFAAGSGSYPTTRFVEETVYAVDNHILYAVEEESRGQWTEDIDGSFQWTVVDDSVYLGADLSSTGAQGQSSDYGRVYALDRRTGTERWAVGVGGDGVSTTPVADEDTVYVGQDNGRIHALASPDGSERWVHRAGGEIEGEPVVTEDTVVAVVD